MQPELVGRGRLKLLADMLGEQRLELVGINAQIGRHQR